MPTNPEPSPDPGPTEMPTEAKAIAIKALRLEADKLDRAILETKSEITRYESRLRGLNEDIRRATENLAEGKKELPEQQERVAALRKTIKDMGR